MSAKIIGQVWDLDLPHAQAWVLMALADHADHEGNNVRPSVGLIAWKTNYSERQVQRIMAELREAGILKVVRASVGKVKEYSICLDHVARKAARFTENTAEDTRQNVTPDKTSPLTQLCHPTPDTAMSPRTVIEPNTHTPRETQSETQTFAHPAKPGAITHSKPHLENVLPSNPTPDLLRGGDLKNAVLDTIGARLRYEMGSFSHADRMRLDAFVNYLHAAQRTPADLSEYEKRLPHYLNKANPNRPTLDQLIKNFDNVLSMDLTPQPTRQPRWQAPAPTPAAPDAAATQTLFAERQARRAALANSQVTP